jgi:hypothetical protein
VIEEVRKLKVPTLMLDAGNEDLFDTRLNSGKAYEIFNLKTTPRSDTRRSTVSITTASTSTGPRKEARQRLTGSANTCEQPRSEMGRLLR